MGTAMSITRLCAMMAFARTRTVFKESHEWMPSPRGVLRMVDAIGAQSRTFLDLARQSETGPAPEGMLETTQAAKQLVTTCKAGVDTVVRVNSHLRQIASNPVGAAGKAVLGFASCTGVPLTYVQASATIDYNF